jgi:Cdc6-like AAA superfamily ATPase
MLTRSRLYLVGGEAAELTTRTDQDLIEDAISLATHSSDLRAKVEAHPEFERELRRRVSSLDKYQQHSEWKSAAAELSKRKPLDRIFLTLATVGGLAAFGFSIYAWIDGSYSLTWAFLSAFFGTSLISTSWGLLNGLRHAKRLASIKYMDAEAALSQSVNAEAEGTLSEIVNRHLVRDQNEPPCLEITQAPRLVEMESDKHITSKSVEEITDFVREHKSSAIGLSGPRGVGKTTVMKEACKLTPSESEESPAGYLGVYLPIPVKYVTMEFIRHLHGALAREMVGAGQVTAPALGVRRTSTVAVRGLVGGVIASAGAIIVLLNHAQPGVVVSGTDAFGIFLALTGTLIYVVGTLSSVKQPKALPGESIEVTLGREALDSLAFNRKEQRLSKNVLRSPYMWVEDQDQVEVTERERSHPESVEAFKAFAKRYCNETRKSIILAIDELDKLDRVDDALEFINGIKDLLHVEGVHFIVSVSDDALNRFDLRGVPVRDAFDSSFDTIVPVRRFDVNESRTLLERRAVHFPDELTLYCHSLSGGLPRDLIRSARQCVSVRRAARDRVPVPEVVYRVTRQRALSVAEATLAKVRETDRDALRVCLKVISGIETATDSRHLVEVLETGMSEFMAVPEQPERPSDIQRSCAAFFSCLATSCSWFSQNQTVKEWRERETAERSEKFATQIAKAVAALNIDPDETKKILYKVRRDLNWDHQGRGH